MTRGRGDLRVGIVLGLLVLLHFTLRPWMGNPRGAPDFLLLALMIYAIRARPGRAAIAGFIVGILGDALAGVAFGAGALAYTVIGYLLAWGKAVFFPDNLLVTGGLFFLGGWARDLMVLLAGGQVQGSQLLWEWGTWSLLQAATTAATGVVVLIFFRRWLVLEAV